MATSCGVAAASIDKKHPPPVPRRGELDDMKVEVEGAVIAPVFAAHRTRRPRTVPDRHFEGAPPRDGAAPDSQRRGLGADVF
jgi:hypothetical protein